MCDTFLEKMIFHMESLVILVNQSQDVDAPLMARTMLEGTALLIWASRESKERADDWRLFSCVEIRKDIEARRKLGEAITPEQGRFAEEAIARHGARFYRKGSQDKASKGEAPYRRYWHGKGGLDQIFKEAGGEDLYNIYTRLSAWVHWSIVGMGNACKETEEGVTRFTPRSEDAIRLALSAAFQSLIQTALLGDQAFGLGYHERLTEIGDRYIKRFSKKRGDKELGVG